MKIIIKKIERNLIVKRTGVQGPPGTWDGPRLYVQPTPPENPQSNDIWIQTES